MRSDEEVRSGQLADADWGYLTVPCPTTSRAHLVTLRHFDTKVDPGLKTGPLIPCERRLAKTEIQEFQEVTFGARFETGTMTGLMDIF